MNLPSRLLEDAVEAFASLPGIGRKTALRLVLHMLRKEQEEVDRFSSAVSRMRREIKFCKICRNVCDRDSDICGICANHSRSNGVVCVVENLRDLLAIEYTGQYRGRYHILGGVISPIDGVGPEDLEVESLIDRAKSGEMKEVIMALSPTIEGDTTIYYLSNRLKPQGVEVTALARGVSFGGDLEYVDEVTLARSIAMRTKYTGDENQALNGDPALR